ERIGDVVEDGVVEGGGRALGDRIHAVRRVGGQRHADHDLVAAVGAVGDERRRAGLPAPGNGTGVGRRRAAAVDEGGDAVLLQDGERVPGGEVVRLDRDVERVGAVA